MLTRSPTDVLSHVAIRARSQGLLLATCFDDEQLQTLQGLAGKHVSLTVSPTQEVMAVEMDAPASRNGAGMDYLVGQAEMVPSARLRRAAFCSGACAWATACHSLPSLAH